MNWRFIATDQTHDAELPVDLRAFDPPAHQATFPYFFLNGLQRHDTDAHVFFHYAVDGRGKRWPPDNPRSGFQFAFRVLRRATTQKPRRARPPILVSPKLRWCLR